MSEDKTKYESKERMNELARYADLVNKTIADVLCGYEMCKRAEAEYLSKIIIDRLIDLKIAKEWLDPAMIESEVDK